MTRKTKKTIEKAGFARNLLGTVLFALCGVVAGMGFSAPPASANSGRGDAAVAERFVIWAEEAIEAGQWAQALAALERGNDFADVSSDISYLLAYVRFRSDQSRFLVLQNLEKAIEVNQWRRYNEARARLLKAEQLIALRRFHAALDSLDVYRTLASETIDSALLRLRALKGLALAGLEFPPAAMPTAPAANFPPAVMPGVSPPAALEFRNRVLETMDRNPADPRPLRIFFDYAARRQMPNEDDLALMEIALLRLPFLLDADPALAWMAAPFVGNLEDARRMILAYRAGSFGPSPAGFSPNPASIAPALNLGLLDDIPAVEEFFSPDQGEPVLDIDLIAAVGDLLRSDEGRDYFAERLHSFTGAITRDENLDGIPESRSVFRDGVLQSFFHDADQDGIPELSLVIDSGLPVSGSFVAMPEAAVSDDDEVAWAFIVWSRYPAVQQVLFRGETFIFAPGNFHYSPIGFENLGASATFEGLLVPVRNHLSQGLTRRALVMSAIILERPCLEFEGGTERVYMRQGVPVLSEVSADGLLISVTEFQNGFPVIQRVDLDRDGRMETIRRFRPGTSILRSSSSDWDGDGVFEYVEVYLEDGSVVHN